MATLVSLRSAVSDVTRDPNNRIRPTATVDRAINNAYQNVQQDLESYIDDTNSSTTITITGAQEYSLPADFQIIQQARYQNGTAINPLTLTTKKNVQDQYGSPTVTGSPTLYYTTWTSIWLYPVPSTGSILVNYTATLPTITTSVDSENHAFLDEALTYKAVSLLFKQVQKFQEAAIRELEYIKCVDSARLSLRKDENRSYLPQYDRWYVWDYSRQIGYY